MHYIMEGVEPAEKSKVKKLRMKVTNNCIIKGKLYKRSYLRPLLKFLESKEL